MRVRRRGPAEWAVRALLAAALMATGYVSVTRTLGYGAMARDFARAHALAPGDGRITALLAQQTAVEAATPAQRARADALARDALRREPIAVAAVSALGLNAEARGDKAGAGRLFAFAERLSRRDLVTQIWAVEDAVGRGDVAAALRHYDIALRTAPAAPDLFYPVLSAALADPAIRVALVRTLAARPAWGGGFVDHVAIEGPDRLAAARLMAALGRAGVPVSTRAQAAVIGGLLGAGEADAAWTYYATLRPGVDRRRSRDPGFVADPAGSTPFDWMTVGDASVSTAIQSGAVEFAAPPSVGAPLLRQMQLLPPGRYRLDGRSQDIDQPEGTRPYWMLTCPDGRELGRVAVPGAGTNGGFVGDFTVPAGCPVQSLVLVARPTDAITGLFGRIDHVRLEPAR